MLRGGREQLVKKAVDLLEVEAPELEITLDEMLCTEDVIRDEEAIYLPPFFFSETGCAKRLIKLLSAECRVKMDVQAVMSQVQQQSDISYDEIQLEAIRTAVSSKVMILTDGPGTGKNTTTMGIISAYRKAGCRIILAAPTGRAAKRMSETAGMEAKAIPEHMTLIMVGDIDQLPSVGVVCNIGCMIKLCRSVIITIRKSLTVISGQFVKLTWK